MKLGLTLQTTALAVVTMTAVSCDNADPGVIQSGSTGLEFGSTGDNADSATTDGLECSTETTEACCCFSEVLDEEWPATLFVDNACETTDLCEEVRLMCPGEPRDLDCADTAFVDDRLGPANDAALTCVLEAMAAGRTGHVSWELTAEDAPGWARRETSLFLFEGQAVEVPTFVEDLGFDHGGARQISLRPAADFAACRDAATQAERLECLFNPAVDTVQQCVPASEGY